MKTFTPQTIITCLALLLLTGPVWSQTVKKTSTTASKPAVKKTTKPVANSTKSTTTQKKPAASTTTASRTVKDTAKTTTAAAATQTQPAAAKTTTEPAKENKPATTAAQQPQPAKQSQPVAEKVKPPVPSYQYPFAKGNFSFINRKNIDYTSFKNTPGNSHTSSPDVDLDLNYFFLDNFAAGIILNYYHYNQGPTPKSSYTYFETYLSLTYGRTISPRVNIYGKIAGGIGNSKSFVGSTNSTLKADYKDIYGTIGAPIAIEPGSPVFVTPFITYGVYKTKAGNHDITERGISGGIRLETYINTRFIKNGKTNLGGRPKKGAAFVEYVSGLNFSSSTRKEYQGTIRFGDVKKSSFSLGGGFHYYFLDDLAAGLNINLQTSSSDNGSPDKRSSWSVQPTVTVHPPLAGSLHNLFLQVGYGFGKGKLTGTPTTYTAFNARVGYNIFLSRYISISPKIGYQSNSDNHKTGGGDYVYKDSGFASELGVRAWFN